MSGSSPALACTHTARGDYLSPLYGAANYSVAAGVSRLPAKLADSYRKLAGRRRKGPGACFPSTWRAPVGQWALTRK